MSVIIKIGPDGELPAEAVSKIAGAISACRIVAFPTDTVYGLGSTGLVRAAMRKIYQLKGRSDTKPLPILVHSREAAKRWVQWTPAAEALSRKYWPGALTLVLRPTQDGRLLKFAEYPTVAIRVPKHGALLRLIEASGVPWASTSANFSDSPALRDGQAVARQFAGLVDFIIDGGEVAGTESTVVDATDVPVRVLRTGAISPEDVAAAARQAA